MLYGFAEVAEDGAEIWTNLALDFSALTAFSFMLFTLIYTLLFAVFLLIFVKIVKKGPAAA